MADTKISAMTAAATLDGTEIMPLVQGGDNVQQTVSDILDQGLAVTELTSLSTDELILPGLTGFLYANDTSPVTASTTIAPSDISASYGVFQHNVTQTNTTPGSGIPVRFGTTDIGGHGVSISNDGSSNPTKVVIANAGLYNFQFSLQLNKNAGGASAIDVYVWAAINGTDVPETNTRVTIQGPSSYTVAAWNLMLNMTAGQYFQLMWGSADSHAEIAYISPAAIGPIVPSVILTVNQVA